MNLSKFIIHRKTTISMLFIGLCLLGIISYRQLGVELMPSAELPFLIVNARSVQDVDPDYVEKQAIIPLEGAITTLPGISEIESFADRSGGTIYVYFNQNVNIKYSYLRLEEKVNAISSSLQDDFRVSVIKVDTDQLANAFMNLQVRGSGGVDRVRQIVDEEVTDELLNIDGMANAEVFGGREQSIEIILNSEACRAYNVTPAQIQQMIAGNSQYRTFVGHATGNSKKYFVNIVAEYSAVSDLENIVVNRAGPIRLKDVATIHFGIKEPTSLSRINGKEAVTINLVRDNMVNLIDLSRKTQQVIAQLNKKLAPSDIEIVIQYNSAESIETNIDMIIELAIIGSLLAVFVLWLFLKNLKLVLIIALAIPVSIITAFNLFYYFDITINSFTLVGIVLAVGMLVDNSVVVLENIYRHMSKRRDAEGSVLQGSREVWRSIFASTLTTVAVFLPFVFATNYIVQILGKHISVSIITTLLISLLVAVLLIPMMTYWILSRTKTKTSQIFRTVSQKNRLVQLYNLVLKTSLRKPARTTVTVLLLFFVTLFIALATSREVSEEVENREFNLYVTMPKGAVLETTDQLVANLEEELQSVEEILNLTSQIYDEEAVLSIELKEEYYDFNRKTIPEIKNIIERRVDRYDDVADISFDQPSSSQRYRGGGGGGGGLGRGMSSMERMLGIGRQTERIVIKGTDFAVMEAVSDDIEYYMEDLSSVSNTSVNISDNRPEVHLLFDHEILNHYDVSPNRISSELRGFQSEINANLTFKQGVNEYDIVIREEVQEDKTIDDLRRLDIPSDTGDLHELQDIAQIVFSFGSSGIRRINQEKQIEVSYRFVEEVLASKDLLESARMEVEQIVANLQLPRGVAVEVVHQESELEDFYLLIGTAFLLIYMILASVFESLTTPVVMLFTIPLASVGALWGLVLTGNSILNANSLMGFLILQGIVVNNGIIFIDYTRILQKRGYSTPRAIMAAGQARVRPILITAITTIVAMIPLAMGNEEYVSRIGAPFAITVIGGLALSTLFTLVIIPTVYSGMNSSLQWLRNLDWKVKLLLLLLLLGSWALIYFYVDSLVMRILDIILSLLLIPAAAYFIMVTLRQAGEEYIKRNEQLHIVVQRLVKIYDGDSRFKRDWKKSSRTKENQDEKKREGITLDFILWAVPLLGFLVYFIYFYIRLFFWVFVFIHILYFFGLYLINTMFGNRSMLFHKLFKWWFPFFNLVLFYFKWKNPVLLIFIGIVWYILLVIYTTSERLHSQKVNIARITGRMAGLRRFFYRFVQVIPIVGKRKTPFRALNGVSLQIESGMFGLLGPNGAGKTTLMRIICGVLEQSRGKIWINGIDIQEKREELQGLIGYLPQEFGMYENMTAYEFLNNQAILKNILDNDIREQRITDVLKGVHMLEHRDKKIGSFSGGMKQRIGIAQTLLHLPRILVVDEPTAGLDPRERIRFRNLLVELSRDRIVIFSTHIIEDISSSCNLVAVLNRGNLKYVGDTNKMANLAKGVVWEALVPPREFEQLRDRLRITHHMRVQENIRIRILSEHKPLDSAVSINPSLEDAYLWLLGHERRQVV
ncbi:efflux RND transporter permease subunit [candidate division KSB1 bacterium]|nr:efflux RND transporter permease subunit [candidate division KSB1 bacterium]